MSWDDGLEAGTSAYEIAASENAHLRVVAGPGAGKSFAMKRRVARLIESGVAPKSILPITFTRVAAEDLHRELVGMNVEGCAKLKGTTLHSLALRVLMRNHVLAATGRTPRLLNEFEVKPLEVDLNSHGRLRIVRRLLRAYEAAWARLQHEEPGFTATPDDQAFANDLVNWLRFHEAMLIGEVIPQFYEYLRSNPAAPEKTEYAHVLVDEYQDLNKAEQSAIELLSGDADVCIVGDDDQSIYSFKHAHPEGIREWIEVHLEADDLTLAECRRCPTTVVEMANSLISHNRLRPVPRTLESRVENGEGDVRIIQFGSLDEEVAGVVSLVAELIESGAAPGHILILAQRGVIGNPIYEGIVAAELPVKSYYAEAELNDAQAQRRFSMLKLYVNREDRVSLRWLLGLGSNNWRSPAYSRVRHYCSENNLSPWQVLTELHSGNISIAYTTPLINPFGEIVAELDQLESCENLQAVVDLLFPDGDSSVRDIRTTAFEVLDQLESEDRERFLSDLVSAIAAPEVPTEIEDVRIMSLHKSKGLSAPVTIIAGCVEGLLPMRPDSSLSAAAQEAYTEEQRRLFYVGISRVKAAPADGLVGTLILTNSQEMAVATARGAGIAPASTRYGTARLNASRFIRELGPRAPNPIAG
ncbi:MAG: UvrD-helicase domain-containing protein [Acidobacteriota bacterium]